MSEKRRKRHRPEQIVNKLRDADAMLGAGKDQADVLQALEVSESTLDRWRRQYGGMKSEEAVRLKKFSAIRVEAARRRAAVAQTDAAVGASSSAVRLPPDRGVVEA